MERILMESQAKIEAGVTEHRPLVSITFNNDKTTIICGSSIFNKSSSSYTYVWVC